MPVWSLDEIHSCHAVIYPHINEDILRARYFVLGGVPRYLFDNLDVPAATIVNTALANTRWDVLKRVASSFTPNACLEASHRLIHLYNADNGAGKYRDYKPVFASNFVSAMAYNSYFKERRDITLDFLQETFHFGYVSSLRGHIFESLSHLTVSRGGNYVVKELYNGDNYRIFDLFIKEREVSLVSDSYDDIASNDSYRTNECAYFRPLSKTFECIDAWIFINGETWCFQYTVGKTHKISQAIYWYYQNLNCKHYVTFVYDQSTFDSFKYTSIGITKKNVLVICVSLKNFL
jgi:hypothetical protein